MKYLFILLLLIHGIIHVMGFTKAFNLGRQNLLTDNISKPAGFFWLITMLIFFTGLKVTSEKIPGTISVRFEEYVAKDSNTLLTNN